MPKSQYVDPGKVFERGFAEFTPIPLCQYNKTLKEEKAIYTKEDFLRIYRDMRIIREFETMLNEIKVKSVYNGVEYHNPGPAHLSIGQEASAVGQAYCLDINDFTFGSHRSHGEIIAKGGDDAGAGGWIEENWVLVLCITIVVIVLLIAVARYL